MKKVTIFAAMLMSSGTTLAATYVDTGVVTAVGNGSGSYGPGTGGPGVFDLFSITGQDDTGYALGGAQGTAGQLVVSFSAGSVFDGTGNDFTVFDNFGLNEGLQVEGSADGVSFVSIGAVGSPFSMGCTPGSPCAASFDLMGSGLASAKFFRLTAVQGQCVLNYPECYDVDTLEALNFRAAVPEPASWAMMIGGFAVLGGTVRRKRTVAYA